MTFVPQYRHSQNWVATFQPAQIICLEFESNRLYAEVIQMVETHRSCWARPLALLTAQPEATSLISNPEGQQSLHDLRQGSDLLLPAVLFRPALDTEVVPLLSELYISDHNSEKAKATVTSQKHLSQFIQRICQAYPNAFSPSST
jgi:hypothetical protein